MDIQWDNFSKDAYEDIKSIVKDPNYLPETGKDFLQNLHKASIRMGAYAAIFDGGTNFTDNFFFDDPNFPNAIEIKVGRIVNSHSPNGILLDMQDTFSIPITKKHLDEVESFQDFQKIFEADLQQNIDKIQRPDLLDAQAMEILQQEIDDKKAKFQETYPHCEIVEPKDTIFYSPLEDPKHPLMAIPRGYTDNSKETHTLSIINEELLEASHGKAKATITFPDEHEWSFALFADFSYNGKTFVSDFFAADALPNAMHYLDDCYIELQNVIERTERLATLDGGSLPKKERDFVQHYQELLAEDAKQEVGTPTYGFSKLYNMATDAAKYVAFQKGTSNEDIFSMLQKYSPGANLYGDNDDFPRIVLRSVAETAKARTIC